MAVDRDAVAWVNYVKSSSQGQDTAGAIYKVSTADASCTKTDIALPSGFFRIGMEFATDSASSHDASEADGGAILDQRGLGPHEAALARDGRRRRPARPDRDSRGFVSVQREALASEPHGRWTQPGSRGYCPVEATERTIDRDLDDALGAVEIEHDLATRSGRKLEADRALSFGVGDLAEVNDPPRLGALSRGRRAWLAARASGGEREANERPAAEHARRYTACGRRWRSKPAVETRS